MKIITLDGENFSTKYGFYREIRGQLCPDTDMGMNLDALNDVLRGGFGVTAYGEPLIICWKNFAKSRQDLGARVLLNFLRVMLGAGMEHDVKLVLQSGEEPENTAICQDAPMLILRGEDFDGMEGFYQAMDALLTDGTTPTGHNLDALNDLLGGGFGAHGVGEPIALCWADFDKSCHDLGDEKVLTILTILLSDGYGHDVHVILN